MDILVAYDIAEPKRLRRVAKLMNRYGVRVQKSVFECDITDPKIKMMTDEIKSVMDTAEDSLRVYPLLANARSKATIIGCGEKIEFPDCLTV